MRFRSAPKNVELRPKLAGLARNQVLSSSEDREAFRTPDGKADSPKDLLVIVSMLGGLYHVSREETKNYIGRPVTRNRTFTNRGAVNSNDIFGSK